MYRTHHCNELRVSDIGKEVLLSGWVDSRRDHGGVIFIDLRDREGMTQVVFRPEEFPEVSATAHTLRSEDVVQVKGQVAARLEGMRNSKIATGDIEVIASSLAVLNRSAVLPFPLDTEVGNEDLRLTYRYLDLRRAALVRNLKIRHLVTKVTREYLGRNGYLEIETPILSKSTPEGAREFLVPSRLNANHFYALSQSPQQYKQLLMVGGIEKYFQIAKCFRDEDPRADRITELTQIDLEASFVEEDDVHTLVEGLMKEIFRETEEVDVETPFLRLTYREAMDRFGSDKPDLRFGMELLDVADVFKNSQFKMWVNNEIILSWMNDEPCIACPDLITMIDHSTFEPVIIGKLNEGTNVIVFGMPAPECFRSPAAIQLLGPRHFGFDLQAKRVSEM